MVSCYQCKDLYICNEQLIVFYNGLLFGPSCVFLYPLNTHLAYYQANVLLEQILTIHGGRSSLCILFPLYFVAGLNINSSSYFVKMKVIFLMRDRSQSRKLKKVTRGMAFLDVTLTSREELVENLKVEGCS